MSDSVNRRHFLSQGVASGVALGAAISTRSVAANFASRKVVVGVMGLSRGKELALGFSKQADCVVKYVCDVDKMRAEAGAAALTASGVAAPQAIGDFRKILDDPEIDALVCAAPNHWHAPATILACAAGKHVYVEKPCSHNPAEGELMVQAARAAKRAVQMGTQRRSGPRYEQAVAMLREGAIGRVYCVRSWYNNSRPSIGIGKPAPPPAELNYELWQGPAPRMPYVDNRIHYNWHWLWHWGNGELGNNGVHALDMCRWGAGVDYPIRVTSSGGRYCHADDQQTPDTHIVAFEFPDRQTITWQGLSCNKHSEGFVTFYGEKGTLALDSNGGYVIFDEKDKQSKKETGPRGDEQHLANFLAAIRDDKPLALNTEIEEGHKSTLLCHLGNIAHRTGRVLNCNPSNGHILGDEKAAAYWRREYEPRWEPKAPNVS